MTTATPLILLSTTTGNQITSRQGTPTDSQRSATALEGIRDKLAEAFSTPEGITRLNAQLSFLDARTQATIESLFRQGKAQEAIALAVDRLPPALAKSENAQGAVTKAWEAIKNAASDADNAVGRFIDRLTKGPSVEQKLKAAEERVRSLKEAADERIVQPGAISRTYVPPTSPTVASTTRPTPRNDELKDAKLTADALRDSYLKAEQAEQKLAETKALEKSLNDKSVQLNGLTKEVGAGSEEFRKYKNWQIAVDDALKSGNPDLMRRVDSVKDLSEASGILEHVTKSMANADGSRMTAAEKSARSNALEIEGIRANTVEGRARVAAMRQEEQQRGQLITAAQAQTQAEHAAQAVREQANQALRDTLRDQGLEAEEIRKRIALLSQDAETRAVTIARQQEEQKLIRQGVDLQGELAQKTIAGAEANARLGVSYDRAADGQRQMQDATREIGQEFTSFIDEALLGTGKLQDAFKSLAKTFSSNTLNALLTGQGPLAGLFGTAATEKGQLGGLLGGQISLGSLFGKDFERAISGGASNGIAEAFGPLLKPRTGASGQSLGFALTPRRGPPVDRGRRRNGLLERQPIRRIHGGRPRRLLYRQRRHSAGGSRVSTFTIYAKGRRALMLSDTAGLDQDGIVRGWVSKVVTIPHLRMAITTRGASAGLSAYATDLAAEFASFDAMIAEGAGFLSMLHDRHLMRMADLSGQCEFDLALVGWSEARRGCEAHAISSLDYPGLPAFTFMRQDILVAPEPPRTDLEAAGLIVGGIVPDHDPEATLLGLLELQRHQRVPVGGVLGMPEHFIVGGQVVQTEITEAGISQRIVRTWPDEIGRPIRPAAEASGASSIFGRHQRRQAEKLARRAARVA